MVIRPKKRAPTTGLELMRDPPPALMSLVKDLDGRLASQSNRKRCFKAKDATRNEATLTAFTVAITKVALSRVPAFNGASISFDDHAYVGSDFSPTALRKIRDGMSDLGLIVFRPGFYSKLNPEESFRTGIRPTGAFQDLAEAHGLTFPMLFSAPSEVIVLRDGDGSVMPPDVAASGEIVRAYNAFIRDYRLTLPDQAWLQLTRLVAKGGTNGKGDKLSRGYSESRIYLTRRFAENYERGGRLYDGFYQTMPKVIRSQLLIDGETTVELDFSRIHPTLLFAEKGLPLDRDPYCVPGFDVSVEGAKETFNRLLNSRRKINYRSKRDKKWFKDKGAFNTYRDAMIDHLSPIADSFQRDKGARLQKKDSDLALVIIADCMMNDIPVYPVHDSFIVRESDKVFVQSLMHDSFLELFGYTCNIKR